MEMTCSKPLSKSRLAAMYLMHCCKQQCVCLHKNSPSAAGSVRVTASLSLFLGAAGSLLLTSYVRRGALTSRDRSSMSVMASDSRSDRERFVEPRVDLRICKRVGQPCVRGALPSSWQCAHFKSRC